MTKLSLLFGGAVVAVAAACTANVEKPTVNQQGRGGDTNTTCVTSCDNTNTMCVASCSSSADVTSCKAECSTELNTCTTQCPAPDAG
jgi:hypothetical protein